MAHDLAAVRAGFGVAIAPASVRRLQLPGLVWRELADAEAKTTMYMCWIPDRIGAAAAKFVHILATAAGTE